MYEPLRAAPGDVCLTSGRLEVERSDEVVAVTYRQGGAVALDFGADGSVDQDFPRCTDVPMETCTTNALPLCGACTGPGECQRGLVCFPCAGECSGDTKRCTLPADFATCEDGVF